ncbi:MAG: DinB family protein [Candidatus Bipolaricaulota bacterium]|nr:DinB family protein [Candidatus Bipolaricaulota bacterium]
MNSSRALVTHWQQQFEAAYRGSRWHSVKEAIKGLKADEATWQPPHYKGFPWAHGSIIEILFHVAGDTLYQLDYAFGQRTLTWDKLQERFQRAGGDLDAAKGLLDESFSVVQEYLKNLTDADLARTYIAPDGKTSKTLGELFQMLLEHWFYHAGQIVYVRNLWAGLSSPNP